MELKKFANLSEEVAGMDKEKLAKKCPNCAIPMKIGPKEYVCAHCGHREDKKDISEAEDFPYFKDFNSKYTPTKKEQDENAKAIMNKVLEGSKMSAKQNADGTWTLNMGQKSFSGTFEEVLRKAVKLVTKSQSMNEETVASLQQNLFQNMLRVNNHLGAKTEEEDDGSWTLLVGKQRYNGPFEKVLAKVAELVVFDKPPQAVFSR